MTDTPFVSLDAQYLATLAESFERDDFATFTQLKLIASRLEGLDERVRNLASLPGVELGKRLALDKLYARANIPPEPSEVALAEKRLSLPPIKRIPQGLRALEEGTKKPRQQAPAKPVDPRLAGIKIKLSL